MKLFRETLDTDRLVGALSVAGLDASCTCRRSPICEPRAAPECTPLKCSPQSRLWRRRSPCCRSTPLHELEIVRWNYCQVDMLRRRKNDSPFHFGIGLAANAHFQLHLLALANSRIVESLQDLGNSQFSQGCKSIRLKRNGEEN